VHWFCIPPFKHQVSSGWLVPIALYSAAAQDLSVQHATIAFSTGDIHADADTWATDTIFPECEVFLSYGGCHTHLIILCDDTQVPGNGVNSTKISLNEKTIILWRKLLVQALRNLLYSLHWHRKMPGCGKYTDSHHCSFGVVPSLTIKVNDSDNNFVRYKSSAIWHLGDGLPINYAKPHIYPFLPPPLMHTKILCFITLPKCGHVVSLRPFSTKHYITT
jgi:hypothetical protein